MQGAILGIPTLSLESALPRSTTATAEGPDAGSFTDLLAIQLEEVRPAAAAPGPSAKEPPLAAGIRLTAPGDPALTTFGKAAQAVGTSLTPAVDRLAPAGTSLPTTGNTLPPVGNTLPPAGDTLPPGGTSSPRGDTLPKGGNSVPATGLDHSTSGITLVAPGTGSALSPALVSDTGTSQDSGAPIVGHTPTAVANNPPQSAAATVVTDEPPLEAQGSRARHGTSQTGRGPAAPAQNALPTPDESTPSATEQTPITGEASLSPGEDTPSSSDGSAGVAGGRRRGTTAAGRDTMAAAAGQAPALLGSVPPAEVEGSTVTAPSPDTGDAPSAAATNPGAAAAEVAPGSQATGQSIPTATLKPVTERPPLQPWPGSRQPDQARSPITAASTSPGATGSPAVAAAMNSGSAQSGEPIRGQAPAASSDAVSNPAITHRSGEFTTAAAEQDRWPASPAPGSTRTATPVAGAVDTAKPATYAAGAQNPAPTSHQVRSQQGPLQQGLHQGMRTPADSASPAAPTSAWPSSPVMPGQPAPDQAGQAPGKEAVRDTAPAAAGNLHQPSGAPGRLDGDLQAWITTGVRPETTHAEPSVAAAAGVVGGTTATAQAGTPQSLLELVASERIARLVRSGDAKPEIAPATGSQSSTTGSASARPAQPPAAPAMAGSPEVRISLLASTPAMEAQASPGETIARALRQQQSGSMSAGDPASALRGTPPVTDSTAAGVTPPVAGPAAPAVPTAQPQTVPEVDRQAAAASGSAGYESVVRGVTLAGNTSARQGETAESPAALQVRGLVAPAARPGGAEFRTPAAPATSPATEPVTVQTASAEPASPSPSRPRTDLDPSTDPLPGELPISFELLRAAQQSSSRRGLGSAPEVAASPVISDLTSTTPGAGQGPGPLRRAPGAATGPAAPIQSPGETAWSDQAAGSPVGFEQELVRAGTETAPAPEATALPLQAGAEQQTSETQHAPGAPGVSAAGAAPRPTATVELSQPMRATPGSPRWAEDLGNRVQLMFEQELPSAELRLHPAHLGRIDVQISTRDDQTSIAFYSSHPAVREALEASLPRLRDLLQGSGVQLHHSSVSDQSPGARRDGQPGATWGRPLSDNDADRREPETADIPQRPQRRAGVDTYI